MSAQTEYLAALKKTPQYMRAMARLMAKAPQNAHIVSTGELDGQLAGLAAKNITEDTATAAQGQNAATELGLKKTALAQKVWLDQESTRLGAERTDKMSGIGGAQVAVSGLMGLARMHEDAKTRDKADEMEEWFKKRKADAKGGTV